MKKLLKNATVFMLVLIAISCSDEKKTDLLIGQWQATSWKVNGVESGRDYQTVKFQFNADKTYSASFGSQSEKGTFRMERDKLYAKAENQIEKMVKIAPLTADSMVMDMNRQGASEKIVFVKKN